MRWIAQQRFSAQMTVNRHHRIVWSNASLERTRADKVTKSYSTLLGRQEFTAMFTRQHADQVVAAYLDEHEVATFDFESPLPRHEDRHLKKLVVVRVDEHDFGWVYFYDSSAHVETGNAGEALAGNAPLIVDKIDGKLYVTGTAHPIEHYLQEYRRGVRTNA